MKRIDLCRRNQESDNFIMYEKKVEDRDAQMNGHLQRAYNLYFNNKDYLIYDIIQLYYSQVI